MKGGSGREGAGGAVSGREGAGGTASGVRCRLHLQLQRPDFPDNWSWMVEMVALPVIHCPGELWKERERGMGMGVGGQKKGEEWRGARE